MHYCGFSFRPADVGCKALTLDDPIVQCENKWMSLAMKFTWTLARNRAVSLLWNLEGFPGSLPVLCSDDPSKQQAGVSLGCKWFDSWLVLIDACVRDPSLHGAFNKHGRIRDSLVSAHTVWQFCSTVF